MKMLVFFVLLLAALPALALTPKQASSLAGLALKCASAEFPNKADHIASGMDDLARPRDAHPSFYGCFDWHSSVHGHWLMVRALKESPGLPAAANLRGVLDAHLSTAAIAGELARRALQGLLAQAHLSDPRRDASEHGVRPRFRARLRPRDA